MIRRKIMQFSATIRVLFYGIAIPWLIAISSFLGSSSVWASSANSATLTVIEPQPRLGDALPYPVNPPLTSPSLTPLKNVPASNLGGWSIDASNRQRVRQFYNSVFFAAENTEISWTGNVAGCQAGTTSSDYKNSVNARVNYFRAMVGVPAAVSFDATFSQKAQEAALMMSANNDLDHTPPSSWNCFSANGSEAASSSNLSLGNDGWDAVSSQMRDSGSNNTIVGHRRWILHPQTEQMGTGDIPENGSFRNTNSLWVFDGRTFSTRPSTRDTFVAWPTKGYNPYPIVPIRWSFAYPNADFSSASVSMTKNGAAVATVIEDRSSTLGEPAIVWIPEGKSAASSSELWEQPSADTSYSVTVSNVIISGVATNFTYSVIVFDPAVVASGEEIIALTGSANPTAASANTYSFNSVSDAESYDTLIAEVATESSSYDAEDSGNSVTDQSDASYSLLSTGNGVSSSTAYALAPATSSESFEITGTFIPSASSTIEFESKLGVSTSTQTAAIQLSKDDGASWQDIYTQVGADTNVAIDSSFIARSVSLSTYANQLIRLRVNYRYSGSHYVGTSSSVSFLIDNISITNSNKVSTQTVQNTGTSTSFTLTPELSKNYILAARPIMWTGYPASEWGTLLAVSASSSVSTDITETEPTQISEVVTRPQEGGSNGYVHYFLLQLSAPLTEIASVDYRTQDQTALAGQDYESTSGTIQIPIGQTHMTIPIRILGDSIAEGEESFSLIISNPQGGIFTGNVTEVSVAHTIVDDD
jgi:uncharacterized protein YkwD